MFDQAQRSLWLEDQLWPALQKNFPNISHLPSEVLITVGYPSSGARGRSEKIRPAELNRQWTGNPNEKMFISIHPVYFDTPRNAAKALLFGAGKSTGARWGARSVGLEKHDDGSITESHETTRRLDVVLADVGDPPAGFGLAFPVRQVQRTRMEKYVCATKYCSDGITRHPVGRAASQDWKITCSTCGNAYVKA
jgi:hypothetical protein